MFEKIIDDLIDEAKPQIIKDIVNEKVEEAPEVEFSEEHNKKMEEIFSKARRAENKPNRYRIMKRVAVVAVAVILVSGVAFTTCRSI